MLGGARAVPVRLGTLFRHTGVQRTFFNAVTRVMGGSRTQHRLLRSLTCRADLGPEAALTEAEQRSEIGEACGYDADGGFDAGPCNDGNLVVWVQC